MKMENSFLQYFSLPDFGSMWDSISQSVLEELSIFQPGKYVELKTKPGKRYKIKAYDTMMVPPVWLEGDPCPHYPSSLKIVT